MRTREFAAREARQAYIRRKMHEVLARIEASPGQVPSLPVPHVPRVDCVFRVCPICGSAPREARP